MNPFNLLSKSFQNGIHPQHLKAQTHDLPIQRVPFGSTFVMPLNQNIGVPCKPVVEKNQRVGRGELIASAGGFVSTCLHSPVTGRVTEIGEFRSYDGNLSQAIEIEADPYASQQAIVGKAIDWRSMSTEEFIEAVQQAGIVGMGGAAFPAHVKFSIPDGCNIRHLLINGAECEPYLTVDHRLMLEQPKALLYGAEIVRQKLGAEETVIGVELNKPEAIEALNQHIQPADPVRVVGLEAKYPQGAEKMIIKTIFDREVPAGQFPRDVEVNVSNVATIVAIGDYFENGMPLIERVITVSGPGVSYPANLIVPLGTPVREALRFCGGLKDETKEVIMGGPMMGRPIASLDAPVVKGSSGILAFTEDEVETHREYPCIRCGRCLEACPYFLNPARLARLAKARMFEEMEDYAIMDCVECGCCSYACPSSIPIVQLIRTGKDQLRNTKASQEMKSRDPDLLLQAAPFLRQGMTTPSAMMDVIIALVPATLAAFWYFGLSAFLVISATIVGAVLTEMAFIPREKRRVIFMDGSGLLTGLLLGLTLPPGLPMWMAFVGGAVAIGFGKIIWGGLGNNLFNPALVGRAFLLATFPIAMTTWSAASEGFWTLRMTNFDFPFTYTEIDGLTAASPLGLMKFDQEATPVMQLFFGNTAGSLGETSSLLLILGGVYLYFRRDIDWRVPASIVITVLIFSGILYSIDSVVYPAPLFSVFSGGLMLGTIYMATDPVTSPTTPLGTWIFGIGIGLLVILIRVFGGMPEGVLYSILLMNSATPLIDRFTQPRIFGHQRRKKA